MQVVVKKIPSSLTNLTSSIITKMHSQKWGNCVAICLIMYIPYRNCWWREWHIWHKISLKYVIFYHCLKPTKITTNVNSLHDIFGDIFPCYLIQKMEVVYHDKVNIWFILHHWNCLSWKLVIVRIALTTL